jgi:hypothetical protein
MSESYLNTRIIISLHARMGPDQSKNAQGAGSKPIGSPSAVSSAYLTFADMTVSTGRLFAEKTAARFQFIT